MEGKINFKRFFRHQTTVLVLKLLAVPVLGAFLLNIVFILDYLFHMAILNLIRLFSGADPTELLRQYIVVPISINWLFFIGMAIASFYIFRSHWPATVKAVYLTAPVAMALTIIGILLYRWPVLSFSLGFIVIVGMVHIFRRTKQPWIYYYSLILTAAALAIFFLSGGEI